MTIVAELMEHSKNNLSFQDRWGGTPLADAVREGHSGVVRILVEGKANLGFSEVQTASQLCELSHVGDIERVRLLILAGCTVNCASYDQRTAMHVACCEGNRSIVDELIKSDADINFQDRWENTPLAEAVREGQYKLATGLHKMGGKLEYDDIRASGELCEYSRRGDVQRIQILLECGCEAGAQDYDLRTAMHLAASEGNVACVQEFIKHLDDISMKDRWGGTPLLDAVREGHHSVTKLLVANKAELHMEASEAAGMLCDFTQKGDIDKTTQLLDAGMAVNATDYDGRTALHLACSEGNLQIVTKLVERGAELNGIDRWGGTPLSDAVREGHTKVAHFLFGKGGQLMFGEVRSSAELCDLVRKGDLEHVTMLLECGCPIDAGDYDQRTCLHLASSQGNLKMLNLMFEYGAKLDVFDRWGGTPLSDAVREGHGAIAKALIARGAELGFDEDKTSGELCSLAANGDVNRIKLLLEGKCDPNAADYDRRTCLHLAASSGNKHVMDLLINVGVNVNAEDRWGGTPLADAVHNGHRQCATELFSKGARLGFDEGKASGELCELAKDGDIEGIRLLIDCGIDAGACDYDGRSVIHLAASMGHKHIVDFLAMKKCMNLAVKDRWGGTALDDAIREGHDKVAEGLAGYYRVMEYTVRMDESINSKLDDPLRQKAESVMLQHEKNRSSNISNISVTPPSSDGSEGGAPTGGEPAPAAAAPFAEGKSSTETRAEEKEKKKKPDVSV